MKIKAYSPGMSDEAVAAKTGMAWKEWFALLDKAGAKKLDHKGIVKILGEQHGVGPWWQQMVTVEYERSRGLREKHETTTGYVANASKTFAVPVEALFDAWHNARKRSRWLTEKGITIRSATPPKVLRITWSDGKGSVEVRFTAKGPAKSQVAVQHSKLASLKAVTEAKAFWKAAMARLESRLS
jgi:uncharacterized protein YndB with AHSA1/START domain